MNYEMLGGGVGGPVNLNQIVAIACSLCNYIWPSYEKLSLFNRTVDNVSFTAKEQ